MTTIKFTTQMNQNKVNRIKELMQQIEKCNKQIEKAFATNDELMFNCANSQIKQIEKQIDELRFNIYE